MVASNGGIKFIASTTIKSKRTALLKRLTAVEGFEQFLHKTFVGQKRFSIEGVDMLVPVLDEIVLELKRRRRCHDWYGSPRSSKRTCSRIRKTI